MPKGYPRTRFDIVDQTHVQEIQSEVAPNPTAVIMATYTSDKGSEDWEYMYGLTEFTNTKGGISFAKHGQAQLLVAEVLRSGGYVFGKRMVSSNATLGNATVKARVVVVDDVSYIYPYATSAVGAKSLEDAAEDGYGDFDPTDDEAVDFPLFTITPSGRGVSHIYFRIVPEYSSSKTANSIKYSFEVYEDQEMLESIMFTMNPDIIIDNKAQSIQAKVNYNSVQCRCKMNEDAIYSLVRKLAKTATIGGEAVSIADMVNYDFINGLDRRGATSIDGIVASASDEDDDPWTANIPADIERVITLSDAAGIPLSNGSYGTMTSSPMSNPTEYTNLMLGAWNKAPSSTYAEQFDPVIYDLDAYKPDAIIDCGFPVAVKNAIIDVCEFRGDVSFLADLGTTYKDIDSIIGAAEQIHSSRFCAVYHNFFNISNPFTKKDITVTMPYLLAKRLVKHISSGAGRPFAGFANNMSFPEIIKGTINYLPVNIPGDDQKQKLVDASINYLSLYDGTPVMETMYTNSDEYTQMSYLHNILAVQEVIKAIRSRCPRTRYTFLDGDDLEDYLKDADSIVKQFQTNFKSINIQYMADERYESNNIFYATLVVQFRNFVQEEYFKVIAIS